MNSATPKQVAFLSRLAAERQVPDSWPSTWLSEPLSQEGASRLIDELLSAPRRAVVVAGLEPGVYENADGIFVVKRAKESGNLYAKRLVEIGGRRLTEIGEIVNIEFEYAPGAIRTILPEHKMSFERARELMIRYGRCIRCGAFLKDATSVERGIGPVCRKFFV